MSLSAIRVPAKSTANAAIIFVHGLGDSGAGWRFLAEEARQTGKFDHVNFVFPNAPSAPVSLNGGFPMPSWYDIYSLDKLDQHDEKGILYSSSVLQQFVKEQTDQGIPASRVVIGGFSQGAALSLATSVVSDTKFAAIVSLSGYLPMKDTLLSAYNGQANKETPYFFGHGTADDRVQFKYGLGSFESLKGEFGRKAAEFHQYEGLEHSANLEEIHDLFKFLGNALA